MQTQSHDKRSAELARRLSARLAVPVAEVLELCGDFDNAVEFAVLEGKSIAAGIGEFLADGDGPFFDELARMIGFGVTSIDFAEIRLLILEKKDAEDVRALGRAGFARMPDLLKKRELSWLEAGFPPAYAETLAYGMDEAECGAEILKVWGLALRGQRSQVSVPLPAWVLLTACLLDENANRVGGYAVRRDLLFNGGKAA